MLNTVAAESSVNLDEVERVEDRLELYIVRSGAGWELRSCAGRGIIFRSYAAAIDLVRAWKQDGSPVTVARAEALVSRAIA